MVPLLFRDGLQMKRIKPAPHNAGATANTLVPVIYRSPAIFSFFPGIRKNLTTPDALPAVSAFIVILDGAIVRALDGFLQAVIQTCRIQYGATITTAVTAAHKLRSPAVMVNP